jgi:hypothetical protein
MSEVRYCPHSPAADLLCGEGFEVYALLCRVEDSDHLLLLIVEITCHLLPDFRRRSRRTSCTPQISQVVREPGASQEFATCGTINATANPGVLTSLEFDHRRHIVRKTVVMAGVTTLDAEMREVSASESVFTRLCFLQNCFEMRNHILLLVIVLVGLLSLYSCSAPQFLQDACDDLAFRRAGTCTFLARWFTGRGIPSRFSTRM